MSISVTFCLHGNQFLCVYKGNGRMGRWWRIPLMHHWTAHWENIQAWVYIVMHTVASQTSLTTPSVPSHLTIHLACRHCGPTTCSSLRMWYCEGYHVLYCYGLNQMLMIIEIITVIGGGDSVHGEMWKRCISFFFLLSEITQVAREMAQ